MLHRAPKLRGSLRCGVHGKLPFERNCATLPQGKAIRTCFLLDNEGSYLELQVADLIVGFENHLFFP